jgi:hypothetical protein
MKSDRNHLEWQGKGRIIMALFLPFFILAMSFIFYSCHSDTSGSEDFLIRIDSVNVPANVNQGASFDIHFYGTIGFSDCYVFKTFNRTMTGNILTIECYGTYLVNKVKCVDQLVTMDGINLNMSLLVPGTYIVIIKEPDSSTIVKQLVVK